jgi:hypothetical protein
MSVFYDRAVRASLGLTLPIQQVALTSSVHNYDSMRIHPGAAKHLLLPVLSSRMAELSSCQSFFGAKKLFRPVLYKQTCTMQQAIWGQKKCACMHESIHIINFLFYFIFRSMFLVVFLSFLRFFFKLMSLYLF